MAQPFVTPKLEDEPFPGKDEYDAFTLCKLDAVPAPISAEMLVNHVPAVRKACGRLVSNVQSARVVAWSASLALNRRPSTERKRAVFIIPSLDRSRNQRIH